VVRRDEITRAKAEAQQLTQRAPLAFAGKRIEHEKDDDERQNDLDDEGDGQLAKPLGERCVLARPVQHFVLLMRLEPHCNARIRLNAGIKKGRRETRLERVEPVMRRGVRILRLLRMPARLLSGLRGTLLGHELALIIGAGKERESEERQHD
jgi:hypothetical protein